MDTEVQHTLQKRRYNNSFRHNSTTTFISGLKNIPRDRFLTADH